MNESNGNPDARVGQDVVPVERVVYLVQQQAPDEDDTGFDVGAVWDVIWGGKWIIIACVLALSAVGVAYSLMATKWYRAEVTLLATESKTSQGLSGALSQLGGLASLAGINIGAVGKAEPLAVLRSKEFAARFIESRMLLPVLLEDRWDAKAARWKEEGADAPDMRDGVEFFDRTVRSVVEDRKSGLIKLTVEWKDPDAAADWANSMVKLVNDQLRDRALTDASKNVAYLRDELASSGQVSLQQSISKLMESELEKAMIARGSDEFAFRIVDKAQVPKKRFWPKRSLICLAAAFLGGLMGLAIVLVRSGAFSGRIGRTQTTR